MKKIIVGLVAIATAVAVNASTVSWGAKYADTVDATKITTGTMYLMYTTGTVDWSALADMTSFTEASLSEIGFTKKVSSFEYANDGTYYLRDTITPAGTGLSSANLVYTVLIGDKNAAGEQWIAYGETPQQITIAAAAGMNQTKTTSAFTYTQAVPEPTSGLLLLLGVAGLALKRKRA